MGSGGTQFDDQDVLSVARLNQKTVFIGPSTLAPSPTYAGMQWYQTDFNLQFVRDAANAVWELMPCTVKAVTATSAVNAVNAEAAFSSATWTIPANMLTVGRVIRFTGYGSYASSSTPTNPRWRVRFGGTGGTILLDSGVITAIASHVNNLFKVDIMLVVISVGANGTIEAQGQITFNSAVTNTPPLRDYALNAAGTMGVTANTAVITINTTTQNDMVLTAFFSSTTAGNTLTLRTGTWEMIA